MTEHDVGVAKDIGSLQADMRTVKHDLANVSQKIDSQAALFTSKIDALSTQIATLNTGQARGLGFFAGAAFVLTSCMGVLIGFAKLLFGPHGG